MITLTVVVHVFTKSNVFTLNIQQIFHVRSRCTNYILLVITFDILILRLRFLCKFESALNYLQNEWSYLHFWRNWNFGLWKWPPFWIWFQKSDFPKWDWWGFFLMLFHTFLKLLTKFQLYIILFGVIAHSDCTTLYLYWNIE